MPAVAAPWKRTTVAELVELLGAPVVGLVDLRGIPARQMNEMRRSLRERGVQLRMTRNRLLRRALDETESSRPGVAAMADEIAQQQLAVITTGDNPFRLYQLLAASRTSAPAKGGETALEEIVVEKGPTGHKAGPMIGELQAAGLPAAIDKGNIIIRKRHVAVRAGETISAAMAAALTKLEIHPIPVSMDLRCAFQDGTFFPRETLVIDLDAFRKRLGSALSGAFNLALYAAYPTAATIGPLLARAQREAVAVGVTAAIPATDTMGPLLAQAYRAMLGVASRTEALDDDLRERLAGQAAAAPAPAAPTTPTEETVEAKDDEDDPVASEEDAAAGLGALFG